MLEIALCKITMLLILFIFWFKCEYELKNIATCTLCVKNKNYKIMHLILFIVIYLQALWGLPTVN